MRRWIIIINMNPAIMSITEACEILGIRPCRLRQLMRTKTIDVGRVVEQDKRMKCYTPPLAKISFFKKPIPALKIPQGSY